MKNHQPVKVLFVCMGNICRSPSAEGVFRQLVKDQGLEELIQTDSAGTHAYHIGKAPDPRAQSAAIRRNIDLSDLRGRQFRAEDFDQFDYVVAMDESNYYDMKSLVDHEPNSRFSLFLEYSTKYSEREVPDPYYGGHSGFEHVLNLIEDASQGLLDHIRQHNQL